MENQFFMNAGFEQSLHPSNSPMPTWQSLSSSMEVQPSLVNSSSNQSQGCFFNPNWEKSTDQNLNFDSALSSIVSSPASPPMENPVMRELIGKLGSFGEISQQHSKLNNVVPMPGFSPDPGFVQRAAKFSCFGSKSFNDRSNHNQLVMNNVELPQRSVNLMENGAKLLSRVSSSPSFNTIGSQMINQEKKKKNSPLQQEYEGIEVGNSQEESTISEQNTPNGEIGVKASLDMNSRKRKSPSIKGKASNSSNPTKVKH